MCINILCNWPVQPEKKTVLFMAKLRPPDSTDRAAETTLPRLVATPGPSIGLSGADLTARCRPVAALATAVVAATVLFPPGTASRASVSTRRMEPF